MEYYGSHKDEWEGLERENWEVQLLLKTLGIGGSGYFVKEDILWWQRDDVEIFLDRPVEYFGKHNPLLKKFK